MTEMKQAIFGIVKRSAAVAVALASPAALYAQGCAMCYQSAANSGPRSIHALKAGILTLMFPTLVVTAGMVFLAYRKRNQFAENG
ncbi:MAG: hypothetical protein WA192_06740 [Candidatus Acidiferrales bacterium]